MTYTSRIFRLFILALTLVFGFSSCKKGTIPGVTTSTVVRILQTNAYSGGQVTDEGGKSISARGVCWSTSAEPTVADSRSQDSIGMGLFTSHITGLTPLTTYYVRAYATNSEGTGYGNILSFTTTAPDVPTLSTLGVKSLTTETASSGGEVTNDGGLAVTEKGVCWNTDGLPTISDSHSSDGSGGGLFFSTMTGLLINTNYHVRSYATNSKGTGYGPDVSFYQREPVHDLQGNAYSTVTIGTQVWLGENLKTTVLNDNTPIANVTTGINWANTTTPAYCFYENNTTDIKSTYGALYNWYAVNTGKLCPTGWHVPTSDEFGVLIAYLGGDKVAGGKLKESGLAHWMSPNLGATNSYGFAMLPGGGRYNIYSDGGAFSDLGYYGYLWSATTVSTNEVNAYSYDFMYHYLIVNRGEYSKRDGESVRCIMDIE